MSFNGKVADAQGKPIAGAASVVFAIYEDQEGGSALWVKQQNLLADAEGSYGVELGATEPGGMPASLFSTGNLHARAG